MGPINYIHKSTSEIWRTLSNKTGGLKPRNFGCTFGHPCDLIVDISRKQRGISYKSQQKNCAQKHARNSR